jgi:uncharacterized protein (TIGR04141 family)
VGFEASPLHYFAFTFGPSGRHYLRDEAPIRGFGLKVALNLMYPNEEGGDEVERLIGFDAKRRTGERVRQKHQAARATTFEVLDLDRFQDVVDAATGRPTDSDRWGTRVSGGDSLTLSMPLAFDAIGQLCRDLLQMDAREDYLARFPWIEHIQPVTDPDKLAMLEESVIEAMRARSGEIDIAPPEVIEWERVDRFQYHFDLGLGVTRPELRLQDYLAGLGEASVEGLTTELLRTRRVRAVGGDGDVVYAWPIWRCLFGEVSIDAEPYVLDDGEFFSVAPDYLAEIEHQIDAIEPLEVALPGSPPTLSEADYNARVVENLDGEALLLDGKLVRSEGATNPVEICDVLTTSRHLIHVKRHLGSRDLSHLFSQGYVSAELLRSDATFRKATRDRIKAESGGNAAFDLVDEDGYRPEEFCVAFVIVADYRRRALSKALPFFSKVNLIRTIQELIARGYGVAIYPLQTEVGLLE